jgi:hypothetical protein
MQVCALYEKKLHDVEEQEKVFHFYHHNEKPTIAFNSCYSSFNNKKIYKFAQSSFQK